MNEKNKKLNFYFSNNLAFLPFIIFIVAVVILGISKGFSLKAFVGFAVVGLIIGTFFSKNWRGYWEWVINGMVDRSTGILTSIFLLAGLFSVIMAHGKVAGGLVWLGSSMGLHGSLFVGFTFLASLLFGLASGTSVGTVITMTPIFYPAGLILGGNPVLLLGAILSGASFGDNLAPVSDTTVISASSQKYSKRSGSAEIGGIVKTRTKYAILAAVISLILYSLLGGIGKAAATGELNIAAYSYPKGLLMLISFVVVILIAVSGRSIFSALIWGIITGSIIGLFSGIFTLGDFIQIQSGGVTGMIPEGIGGVFDAILIFITIMGIMGVIRGSEALDKMLKWSTAHIAKTPRGCEVIIFWLTTIMDLLNAGVTTSVVAIMGPLANEFGQRFKLHPYRRANIVDAVGNTWAYFIPWSAFIFIILSIIGSMKGAYPFLVSPSPTKFFFTVFHPWLLWIIMLVATITGFGREFEGKGGKRIKAWFKNKIPKESLD